MCLKAGGRPAFAKVTTSFLATQALPLGIVFEYLPNGSLSELLAATAKNNPQALDTTQLFYFSSDVARGMQHLAKKVRCDGMRAWPPLFRRRNGAVMSGELPLSRASCGSLAT